jgi:hypothetical protein
MDDGSGRLSLKRFDEIYSVRRISRVFASPPGASQDASGLGARVLQRTNLSLSSMMAMAMIGTMASMSTVLGGLR